MAREGQLPRKIFTQQDRAKNHIGEDDKVFNDGLMDKGINAKLDVQAMNSPDINLLDLGFFRAIQSFNIATPKNEEELIQSVSVAYNNYPQNKINQTRLTLQCCFNQIIIMHNGDNDYNIDHIAKAASQHFRLCIVEMHSRKLRHDDTSARNVPKYLGYAYLSQR